jgi:hypothetical protein
MKKGNFVAVKKLLPNKAPAERQRIVASLMVAHARCAMLFAQRFSLK